jgi:hypothetical protein
MRTIAIRGSSTLIDQVRLAKGGDGRNIVLSLREAAGLTGNTLAIARPSDYQLRLGSRSVTSRPVALASSSLRSAGDRRRDRASPTGSVAAGHQPDSYRASTSLPLAKAVRA